MTKFFGDERDVELFKDMAEKLRVASSSTLRPEDAQLMQDAAEFISDVQRTLEKVASILRLVLAMRKSDQ